MSARKTKRARKTNNPVVRDLPPRESESQVQEEVPQQASQTMPEGDTANRTETTKQK
jgi:hypothetical protein